MYIKRGFKMNKKYKEVYDLVLELGFSPAYIRFSNGLYKLEVFSLNYSPIGEGKKYIFYEIDLEDLKQSIKKELLK